LAPAAGEQLTTEPVVTLHTEAETLLESAGKKEEEAKTELPKVEEVKVEEPNPGEAKVEEVKVEPPQPITYSNFEIPEGFKFNEQRLEETKAVFAKYNLSQEAGQELVNLHTNVLKEMASATLAEQHRVFGEMRKQWANTARADEQIGGSGFETSMQAIARMRDLFVPEKDRASFDEFLRITGAGDHPAFLKLLHNAARRFDEPQPPNAVGTPVPQKKGNGARAAVLYDHPTSQHPR
jgi:hypothetical protein